ncbi:hypothetical protein Trydic_g6484 [Trypoxylus dichotomus]
MHVYDILIFSGCIRTARNGVSKNSELAVKKLFLSDSNKQHRIGFPLKHLLKKVVKAVDLQQMAGLGLMHADQVFVGMCLNLYYNFDECIPTLMRLGLLMSGLRITT